MNNMMTILVTGAAGFIGYHLTKKLLAEGYSVCGLDNLNSYYDVKLKKDRLAQLYCHKDFHFYKVDLTDKEGIQNLFEKYNFENVIHLAAQAGVRYSILNPYAYINSNIIGFLNILEACKKFSVHNLIYASSSSVYGTNKKIPFSETDCVDNPVSLYAATKKTNELFAYTYSTMTHTSMIGLRFFTVYGEWGRPDMAYFSFTKNILENKPINVFNEGNMLRDFTYIDDIVEGISRLLTKCIRNDKGNGVHNDLSYQIFNIGNNTPAKLSDFIDVIERKLGIKAIKKYLPMQTGDVPMTYADINKLNEFVGFVPKTNIETGLGKFIDWYLKYYNVQLTPKKHSFRKKIAARNSSYIVKNTL